jgi:predicted negative regulator of RcsB-dependent stress response
MAETTTENNTIEHEVEETLESTKLGHAINENKNLILILAAVLVAVIIAISVYRSMEKKAINNQLQTLYTFQQGAMKSFADKKMSKDDFVKALNDLDSSAKKNGAYIGVAMSAADQLVQQESLATAIAILESAVSTSSSSSYSYQLVAHQLATLYENAGQTDNAINLLEKMIPNKFQLLLSKVYFDLGRLYLAKGDFNQAKNNFNYVLSGFAKDKLAEYSKIYLQEIESRANESK